MPIKPNDLAKSGFLDLLGDDKADYEVVNLKSVTNSLFYLAALYVETATKNLEASGKDHSGALSKSIVALPVQIMGNVYSVSINIADYYKFVDQGVKGWADEKGGNSPYQFKHYTGKSGQKSSKMITAIQQWIVKEAIMGSSSVHKYKSMNSKRDNFRSSITDTSLSTAIAISRAIKKKGLKGTHFWTKTQTEIENVAREIFGAAIKVDIINTIYGNNNK